MSKNSEMIERLEYLMSGSRVVLNEKEREAVQYAIDSIECLSKYSELTKTLEELLDNIHNKSEEKIKLLK